MVKARREAQNSGSVAGMLVMSPWYEVGRTCDALLPRSWKYKQCEDKATPFESPILLIRTKKKGTVKILNMAILLTFLSKGWVRFVRPVGQNSGLLPSLLPVWSEPMLQGWWERSQDLTFKDLVWKALEARSCPLYSSAVWDFLPWHHLILQLSRIHKTL